MDINNEIQKHLDTVIEKELPGMITDKVKSMLGKVLEDIFSTYSPMAKDLKARVEKQLDINLQNFDMVDYNGMIAKSINDRLVHIVNENAIQPISKLIDEVVGFVSAKEIKLSDIHMMIRRAMQESSYKNEGRFSFFVERNNEHKWYEVFFDEDEKKKPADCTLSFLFNDDGMIFSFRVGSYFQSPGLVSPSRLTAMSKMEHSIYRLYSAGVKVIVDEDDFFDNSFPIYND